MLFALHTLNTTSKHIDLFAVVTNIVTNYISGNGHIRGLGAYGPSNSFYYGEPFYIFDADNGVNLNVAADISFQEAVVAGKPFIETLHNFSSLTNSIIRMDW